MPTRVWLMRHAETDPPGVFHGFESDAGLSEFGRRQAAAAAPVVARWRPDAVYSSAMLRARQTAEPIAAACRLPLLIEPDLHERRMGVQAGTPAIPLGVAPETLRRWTDGDTTYAPPGAESFDQLRDRALTAWDRITAAHPGQSIAIVCHGNVCRVLLISLLPGHTVADWATIGRMRNVAVSELVGEGRTWQAERIAEVPAEVRDLGGPA